MFKEKDLPKYEKPLKEAIDVPLTQYQYEALLSFVFNIGPAKLENREIIELINSGEFTAEQIEDKIDNWHSPSIVIPRRSDEIQLFNTEEYTFRGNEIK